MMDAIFQQLSTVQDGLSPTPPTIASAATITPLNFLTFLTGTTQVATINPPTAGVHLIALIFTNAAPGAFLTSGNIKAAVTPIANVPVYLLYDPISNAYWPLSGGGASLASAQSSPSNPTATASTTLVMMGLAGTITPKATGRILLQLSGDFNQNTTADGIAAQLSFGTGTAPVNGAAVTGTQVGGLVTFTALTGVLQVPFALQAVVTGLTIGTAVWLDAAVKAITGGSASITNLSLTAVEF